MYLHLGADTVVRTADVVAVLDADNATAGKSTADFLRKAQERGRLTDVDGALPKSITVCGDKVYFSQISAATLLKRIQKTDALL